MSSGTHVGIIGNVSSPDPEAKARIKQELTKILVSKPFHPLVIHYGMGQRAHAVARDYARSMGTWRLQVHADGNASIAEACHILVVIAPGQESDPSSRRSDIWSLVRKARASGRTIIHIPVVVQPQKTVSKPQATVRPKSAVKVPKNSRSWALSTGRADRIAGKVSAKYTDFCRTYGLTDSPKSQHLWTEYKRAAGVSPQPRKGAVALPSQRTGGKKSKVQQSRSQPATRLASRASRMDPASREERIAALLRKVNPPDPDVWR